jgi:predicted transcriptional regulator
MALTFKLDNEQAERLIAQATNLTRAVNDLSANLAKWQATQNDTILNGFADLVAVLEGESEDTQSQIDHHAAQFRALREKLQTSINKQPKQGE